MVMIGPYWPPAAAAATGGVFAQQLSSTTKTSTAASAADDDDVASQEPSVEALVVVDVEEGSECNATLYDEWYDSPYSGALLTDLVDFWLFSDAELTNGQVCGCVPARARVGL